ncbi:flagellar FlbD family protein [Paenibacillus kyungheensis]|uniref:Flagellar FlbD family protein n=1 Tax=Paenibacillus kyungheensis TaxID=1452732 RepID=A0AAX3M5W3_9BACL|nr:flagellar FlbD family protein [Paenibacillus kyungheensis]WCT57589.1 flagellar FlbD family protein [Paenibacillus kyungheensis]
MIPVTRLNGSPMWLNSLLIEMIEETPDTYVTLTTGKRIIVLEKADQLNKLIHKYNKSIGTLTGTIKVQHMEELS